MCKKNEQINVGKINASEVNAMAIGTDCLKLNHDFNFIEVGKYRGDTTEIEINGLKLKFVGGILVKEN